MTDETLHQAQLSILYSLRHKQQATFSALMRPTGMQSDSFKFHLRKLVRADFVHKLADGSYTLTLSGKEYANNLDRGRRSIQKQPKLSVLIVARQPGSDDNPRYLMQQRRRQPYYGRWGLLSGPVRWGEPFEAAAARELEKQTSLSGDFTVRSFYRKQDVDKSSGDLLEDKLFAIVGADNLSGELANDWHGGHNAWLTVDELEQTGSRFSDTPGIIGMAQHPGSFHAGTLAYGPDEY